MKLGETNEIVLPVSVKIMAFFLSQVPTISILLNDWHLKAFCGLWSL